MEKYCQNCAIQLASKGVPIEMLSEEVQIDVLESQFNRIQTAIRKQIESYNKAIDEVVEQLRDMQIKDLMTFNRVIDEVFL